MAMVCPSLWLVSTVMDLPLVSLWCTGILSRSEEVRSLLRSFSRFIDSVERRFPAWGFALGLQSLSGSLFELLRTCVECGLTRPTHFRLALASTRRWMTSELCRMESLMPGSGVRYPFLSFRSPWQRLRIPPPLLLGLRAFLYQPYQRENITMGDWYILCRRLGFP